MGGTVGAIVGATGFGTVVDGGALLVVVVGVAAADETGPL